MSSACTPASVINGNVQQLRASLISVCCSFKYERCFVTSSTKIDFVRKKESDHELRCSLDIRKKMYFTKKTQYITNLLLINYNHNAFQLDHSLHILVNIIHFK